MVQVPAVAQVAGGDVNLSGGLVLDDEDVIMQLRQSVALLPQEGSVEAEDDDKVRGRRPGGGGGGGCQRRRFPDVARGADHHQPRAARALASDTKLCGQTTERLIAGGYKARRRVSLPLRTLGASSSAASWPFFLREDEDAKVRVEIFSY